MRVCDVMTRSVVTTRPEVPVKDAALILAGHGFTALPVIGADERLVGMLTEADVVGGRISPDPRRGAWQGSEAGSTAGVTVGEVMSRPALSVEPQADAVDLAATMIDLRLRSVPVVDDDRVVGIVTRRDLVHVALVLAQAVPGVVHVEVTRNAPSRP